MRIPLEKYLQLNAGYETNKYQLTAEQREVVTQRWGDVIRQYGYPIESGSLPALMSDLPYTSNADRPVPTGHETPSHRTGVIPMPEPLAQTG